MAGLASGVITYSVIYHKKQKNIYSDKKKIKTKRQELSQKKGNNYTEKRTKNELLRKKRVFIFSSECNTLLKKQFLSFYLLSNGIRLLF